MLCRRLKRNVLLFVAASLTFICLIRIRGSTKTNSAALAKVMDIQTRACHGNNYLNHPYNFDSFHLRDQVDFTDCDGGSWKQGFPIIPSSRKTKLKVHIVPHSHLDTTWIRTFDEYYNGYVRQILDNVIRLLSENDKFRFQWDAVAFLARWWNETSDSNRNQLKEMIQNGHFDTGAGGWVVPDEALNHFVTLVDQLALGHQWLTERNLFKEANRSAWSLDLFGYSSGSVKILSESGINRLAIHRVHYAIKRHLAMRKGMLEFKWTIDGSESVLTHLTPFYSYDIPHTCGPEPEICCQFDFERLLLGMTCPWKSSKIVLPNRINLFSLASSLYGQFRKKAELYGGSIVLVELGDDFRYSNYGAAKEAIEAYKKVMDYMNTVPKWNVEAKFSTLSEYFNEIEHYSHKTFSGDFLPYSDRANDYWTGYYSTRPYLKSLGTQMIAKTRMTEIFAFYLGLSDSKETIESIRAMGGLYSHHDTVTGTSKHHLEAVEQLVQIKIRSSEYNNCAKVIDERTNETIQSQLFFIEFPMDSSSELAFIARLDPMSFKTYRVEISNHADCPKESIRKILPGGPKDEGDIVIGGYVEFDRRGNIRKIGNQYVNGILVVYKEMIHTDNAESNPGCYLAQKFETKQTLRDPKSVYLIRGPVYEAVISLYETTDSLVWMRAMTMNNKAEKEVYLDIYTDLKFSSIAAIDVAYRLCTENPLHMPLVYSDSNGLQMIRRNIKQNLPKKSNIFPLVTSAFVCNGESSLTVISGQPRGVGFFEKGSMDLLLDRRSPVDDSRGTDEPLSDNRPSQHKFIIYTSRCSASGSHPKTVINVDERASKLITGLHFPLQLINQSLNFESLIEKEIEGLFLTNVIQLSHQEYLMIVHARREIRDFSPHSLVPSKKASFLKEVRQSGLTGRGGHDKFFTKADRTTLPPGSICAFVFTFLL
ncbi:hypothetical protein ACOME3_001655 [Neoechinorhynchus agilis]